MNESFPAELTSVSFCGTTPDMYMKRVLEERWLAKIPMTRTCFAWNVWTLLWTCHYNIIIAFCIQCCS